VKQTIASLVALVVLAVIAVVVVIAPSALTEPFTFHTPDLIQRAYTVAAWGTTITLGLLLAGIVIAYRLWRKRTALWSSLLAGAPLLVLVAAVFFSRQHLAEWIMFAPPATVAFDSVDEATHVGEADYIMGVSVGDEARAYPILMVSYYHIVHDEIAGEPFVVTY